MRPCVNDAPRVHLDGPLARRAHEAAVLSALLAHAVEELLPHGSVVAVAHRDDEAAAVVAQVLHGSFPRDVALVRKEDCEDEHEDADDDRDGEALEAPIRDLARERSPRRGHARSWEVLGKRVAAGTRLNRLGPVRNPSPWRSRGIS